MKIKKENEDFLAAVRELMDDLDLPDWLQRKTINVFEVKQQTMTDQELYRYLKELGQSETVELPDDLMDKQWLQSVYETHSDWVDEEIAVLKETTYESFDMQLERAPAAVKYMNPQTQRSYIAVSSCLSNVFAQVDDILYQEETAGSQSVNKKRGFFHFLKVVIGSILIVFSYLAAVAFFVTLDDGSLILSLITLIIMGMIPFTIGLFLVKPVNMKNFFHHRMFRIYCYFALVVPTGFHIFINLMEWKKSVLADPDFIFLRLASSQWMGILQIMLMLAIIMLAAPIIVWKKNRKKFFVSIGTLLLVFTLLQFVALQDYQAIGKDGVVQSEFGSNETYDWSEVESAKLSGKTDFPAAGGVTNSKAFKWSFQFKMENGESVSFKLFGYKKGPIEDSLQIKHKIKEKNIPLQIAPLTEEDRTFIKIDMDDYKSDIKNDFYELFETDQF